MGEDIVLSVDYHDENCVIRRFDAASGAEQMLKAPTMAEALLAVVRDARSIAEPRGGRVVWIMESTTGWARLKGLLGREVRFLLVNVVQMPQPPKGKRRKTDKIDTGKFLLAYRMGDLPRAAALPPWWRRIRRLVSWRDNLVSRRTALRNWINRYLAHETWAPRGNLWSKKGRVLLRAIVEQLPAWDRQVLECKLAEFDLLEQQKTAVEKEMMLLHQRWPRARRLSEIDGIGIVSAVSIAARIGPVSRFANAEALIAYAGLAPGVYQSDETRRDGRLGGPGTDRHLRHSLMEATIWARRIPRYRAAYERIERRRGAKIGRIVVARMLLRSIYRMLRKAETFQPKFEAKTEAKTEPKTEPKTQESQKKTTARKALGAEMV